MKFRNTLSTDEPQFGVLFDIDGVVARGTTPIPAAIQGLHKLTDGDGHFDVPVAFVTNGCSKSADKAKLLSKWTGIEVSPDQVIHAQSPLKVFTQYHDKHTLFVGQGAIHDIAQELGFTNICTLDQIKDAYPLLDVVDHENRRKVAKGYIEKNFPRVEAIVVIGEPDKWESNLQLLVDLLITNGKPDHTPDCMPTETMLPVLACNMDLVFMAEACMPRFGNGSFLVCLEALYKKITGEELQYAGLIGKPSEITYRYAEHVITEQAKLLGIQEPIERLYFVGDNPNSDIVGSNFYDRYIRSTYSDNNNNSNSMHTSMSALPRSRAIPSSAKFHKQTVQKIEGLLVGTGVYSPNTSTKKDNGDHSHRDFDVDPDLEKPTQYVADIDCAISYALAKENFSINCF